MRITRAMVEAKASELDPFAFEFGSHGGTWLSRGSRRADARQKARAQLESEAHRNKLNHTKGETAS